MTDYRLVPCRCCGSEGVLISVSYRWNEMIENERQCPVCEGSCVEEIEVRPVDRDDDIEERAL